MEDSSEIGGNGHGSLKGATRAIIKAPALESLINQVDWEDAEAVNTLVMSVGQDLNSLFSLLGSALSEILDSANFGKIRVATSSHFRSRTESLRKEVEINHPVALINIVGMLPPLLDYLLRVMNNGLAVLNLPPEVLTNAVFQILEDVDPVELGGFIDSAAAVVNAIHGEIWFWDGVSHAPRKYLPNLAESFGPMWTGSN